MLGGGGAGYGISRNEGEIGEQTPKTDCKKEREEERKKQRKKEERKGERKRERKNGLRVYDAKGLQSVWSEPCNLLIN